MSDWIPEAGAAGALRRLVALFPGGLFWREVPFLGVAALRHDGQWYALPGLGDWWVRSQPAHKYEHLTRMVVRFEGLQLP